ncbi:hypothetical protein RAO22_05170 [Pediococcus acidilactici]
MQLKQKIIKLIVDLAISFMILLTEKDWWLKFVSTILQKSRKIKELIVGLAISFMILLTGKNWWLEFVSNHTAEESKN